MAGKLGAWWLWSALTLALTAACFERPQTRFPHVVHLVSLRCGEPGTPACLTCASCHAPVPASGSSAREPIASPPADRCSGCHGSDTARALEASRRPALAPEPAAHAIRFAHESHLASPAIRGQCVPCHSGAVSSTSELFPPMAQCLSCHEHRAQFEQNECAPCHDARDVARLRPQSFMDHDRDWPGRHGSEARQNEALCGVCHSQVECNDCHDLGQTLSLEQRTPEAIERERVHPADFMTRHALEAASQPVRCLTCHTVATCDGCHAERGVSAQSQSPFNPHPPGWVGGNPGSRDFHGRAARRDIVSCASCHDQGPATNCIRCHSVGGPGGNPHPRGWRSARSESASMCRYCHVQ
jgi:hypothetical protein